MTESEARLLAMKLIDQIPSSVKLSREDWEALELRFTHTIEDSMMRQRTQPGRDLSGSLTPRQQHHRPLL